MNDTSKSKETLQKELAHLRLQVAKLETQQHQMQSSRLGEMQPSSNHATEPDFTGREVLCRALKIIFDALEMKGISLEILTKDIPYPLEHLLDKNERIDWDSYRVMMSNAAEYLDENEFVQMGMTFFDSPWTRSAAVVARLLYSAIDFYRISAKPHLKNGRDFSCIEMNLLEPDSNHIILEMFMAPGYAISPEFFLISKGTLIALPKVVGSPMAQVQMSKVDRGAVYEIQVPKGGGALAGLRRAISYPFTARAAAQELNNAYATLQTQYIQLKNEVAKREKTEEALRQSEESLKQYSEQLEEMVEERSRELFEAQKQLIHQENLAVLGQLAGEVAHELRNPLAVIKNAAYYLQLIQPDASEGISEYHDIIFQRVHESEKIVLDLLALSKSQANQKEELYLGTLIDEILLLAIPPHDVHIDINIPSSLKMTADASQLRVVLMNLVENAYLRMPDGGELSFSADVRDERIRLMIHDSGVTPQDLSYPHRSNLPKSIDFSDKGLALATAKYLIEVNGGGFKLESNRKFGTAIVIDFPTNIELIASN